MSRNKKRLNNKRSAPAAKTTSTRITMAGEAASEQQQETPLPPNGEAQDEETLGEAAEETTTTSKRTTVRKRVQALAKNIVLRPISTAYNMANPIAEVLKDATVSAVDIAVDEVFKRGSPESGESIAALAGKESIDIAGIVNEAFAPMEQSLDDLEQSLAEARQSLVTAKSSARDAMEAIEAAAIAQAEAAVTAVARAEAVAERKALVDFYASTQQSEQQQLTVDDIDFTTSEMAPPFLDVNECLIPGEPVVRVEKAPQNSRRIFAGIDIMASVDVVWNVLTDYGNLHNVVPNLLVNDVLNTYDGSPMDQVHVDTTQTETDQCREIAEQMRGAELRQVGGAKVVGINFSARTTLEVREWPQGLPDFAHFYDEMWQGKSRKERASDDTTVKLERYRFPRPFAMSQLPTRDITMQSVEGDDGEFRMYQGVWRMQPLPGCAPPGQQAMRLTYAVEVSPRAYLPVQLIEGRIVQDLCTNLNAIRDHAEALVVAA